jgi:hypothetical protein
MQSALNLDQFRATYRSGGFRSITIRALGGQFYVTAEPRTGERISLATTHGKKLRAFRNPAKAIEILFEMGAHKVEVDTSEWSPAQAALEASRRPDTAERQRLAHQAAAHDAWFRQQVSIAVEEADDPNAEWVSQEEVKRRSAVRRAVWLGESIARKKATA